MTKPLTAEQKKKNTQGKLPLATDEPYRQGKLDGSGVLKATTPKEIQAAADAMFKHKDEASRLKAKADQCAEEILCLMGKLKIDNVKVYDAVECRKLIVSVKHGVEKLKFEKSID